MENKDLDKPISWVEKMLELARKYKLTEWLEALIMIFILGVMISVFSNPGKVISFFKEAAEEQHKELIEERLVTNGRVQKVCDKLLYSYPNSLRAVLTECHNGQVNSGTGLPFAKISATYESLQDSIFPISGQYRDINISLIPFASYLSDTHYYCGSSISIKNIDKSLAYRLMANKAEYFAAISILGEKGTVGFLIVSFDSLENVDREELRRDMEKASVELSILLSTRK